jgi:hypothetical protein
MANEKLLTFDELAPLLTPKYSVVHLQELRRQGIITAAARVGRRWLFNLQEVQAELFRYSETDRKTVDILG